MRKREEGREKKWGNLIPNSERSPEELREMGRKGGIQSGKSRRRKRELERAFRLFWKITEEMNREDIDRLCNLLIEEWEKR